jgi:anion-transporting  ArsA/GET3 family ATPase
LSTPLFAHRLLIVTGKGGTGKTSVAAALALAASRRGLRVALAEVGRDEHVPRLLAPGSAPVGHAGRELQPGLTALRIDPYAALAEYLGLQLGLPALVSRVLDNRAFRQLMDASPGWRELITLGKVWHLEQMRQADGAPRFDLLIVDAPATGHGLTFLDVPRVVASAVRAGPLHRHAEWVEQLVTDRARTLLLPVALAEELPVRETLELIARVRGDLGVAVDRVVVNAVPAPPFPADLGDLDTWLGRIEPGRELPGLPPPRVLAACASHLRARHALHTSQLDELAVRSGLPCVVLPLVAEGIEGLAGLETLAAALTAGEPAT